MIGMGKNASGATSGARTTNVAPTSTTVMVVLMISLAPASRNRSS